VSPACREGCSGSPQTLPGKCVWDDTDAAAAATPGVMALIKRLREDAGRTEPQRSPDRSEKFEVIFLFRECRVHAQWANEPPISAGA
jgi:hypothetical protein